MCGSTATGAGTGTGTSGWPGPGTRVPSPTPSGWKAGGSAAATVTSGSRGPGATRKAVRFRIILREPAGFDDPAGSFFVWGAPHPLRGSILMGGEIRSDRSSVTGAEPNEEDP